MNCATETDGHESREPEGQTLCTCFLRGFMTASLALRSAFGEPPSKACTLNEKYVNFYKNEQTARAVGYTQYGLKVCGHVTITPTYNGIYNQVLLMIARKTTAQGCLHQHGGQGVLWWGCPKAAPMMLRACGLV